MKSDETNAGFQSAFFLPLSAHCNVSWHMPADSYESVEVGENSWQEYVSLHIHACVRALFKQLGHRF